MLQYPVTFGRSRAKHFEARERARLRFRFQDGDDYDLLPGYRPANRCQRRRVIEYGLVTPPADPQIFPELL